jgi:hypothetical protein
MFVSKIEFVKKHKREETKRATAKEYSQFENENDGRECAVKGDGWVTKGEM